LAERRLSVAANHRLSSEAGMRLKTLMLVTATALSIGSRIAAQSPTAPHGALPIAVPLADVDIRLLRNTGGGCFGRCVHYQVTVRGDGTVRYEDLAAPPLPPKQRAIPEADVVALINEFVGARFFDAAERYVGRSFYALEGRQLQLRGSAGFDGPEWDLSLRLGEVEKSVHLYLGYPENLGQLRDHVDSIGGPKSWTTR
jgi:hypothetical protein